MDIILLTVVTIGSIGIVRLRLMKTVEKQPWCSHFSR